MHITKLLIIIFIIHTNVVYAKRHHFEKYYQNLYCNNSVGTKEYKPARDRFVRVDCLTEQYAIEIDFSNKHYEALGQALYYSTLTNKSAGIWLIVEEPRNMKHAVRLVRNIRLNKLSVTVWVIKPNGMHLYFEPRY